MQKGEIRTYPCSSRQITVRPLSARLWPALENLFGPRGACNGCWCMYWRIGSDYKKRRPSANKEEVHQIVKRGPARGWLHSMELSRSDGASFPRGIRFLGSIKRGGSNVSTRFRCGRSRASTSARAIAILV